MQLTLDPNHGLFTIRSYKPGEILVNERIINNSIILTPSEIIDPWLPQSLSELLPIHLAAIIERSPEIVLLGTGEKQCFPPPTLLADFYKNQIGVEVMNTGAACRTYNVLIAEGRNVIAALLIL